MKIICGGPFIYFTKLQLNELLGITVFGKDTVIVMSSAYKGCLKSKGTRQIIIFKCHVKIATCLLQSNLLEPGCMHFSILCCHTSKHSWKDFIGIAQSSFVTAVVMAIKS